MAPPTPAEQPLPIRERSGWRFAILIPLVVVSAGGARVAGAAGLGDRAAPPSRGRSSHLRPLPRLPRVRGGGHHPRLAPAGRHAARDVGALLRLGPPRHLHRLPPLQRAPAHLAAPIRAPLLRAGAPLLSPLRRPLRRRRESLRARHAAVRRTARRHPRGSGRRGGSGQVHPPRREPARRRLGALPPAAADPERGGACGGVPHRLRHRAAVPGGAPGRRRSRPAAGAGGHAAAARPRAVRRRHPLGHVQPGRAPEPLADGHPPAHRLPEHGVRRRLHRQLLVLAPVAPERAPSPGAADAARGVRVRARGNAVLRHRDRRLSVESRLDGAGRPPSVQRPRPGRATCAPTATSSSPAAGSSRARCCARSGTSSAASSITCSSSPSSSWARPASTGAW